ncbi:MAG: methylated-DNA--[protein]-cysteine S-methyltransferase [Ferruginibacter sp.]
MLITDHHIYPSPLGNLLITCSGEGLHSLIFEKEENTNVSPSDNSLSHGSMMAGIIQQLDDYFSGNAFAFTIPVIQSGTVFQEKVWKLLSGIPAGTTLSYLQLSKRMGDVKSIRAVGTANGRNQVAIVVPCHRVIGSNGSLVGYAGGTWRKKWLLDHEAKFIHGTQTLF